VQPSTAVSDLSPFIESLAKCPKTGLHNPLRNVKRYLMLGDVSRKAGEFLKSPEGNEYFARAIMACMPKSHPQAQAEVRVTADFLLNFSSDNVRFLSRSFTIPGDHDGQASTGHRFPYGPVMIISPFNFPLEIPVLQLMGALYMGNKVVLKPAEKVSVVMEQYIRLLHACGLPMTDIDLLNCEGAVAGELLNLADIRTTQFTGSSRVGEILSKQTHGKVKIEDAGFDWKILGPDVGDEDYVAWQCDQDAYACTGQKCSAQSILFAHENWTSVGIFDKMKKNAETRKLEDLSIGPVMTHTTKSILDHKDKLLAIPGARLLFGGEELEKHDIPECYGAVKPTAVFVPLDELLKPENFDLCVTEIFGPFQVCTEYKDSETDKVLEACERMSHHLTAAVVSNDVQFCNKVLSNTVNGTTYVGRRARTTGAPQNHWFGPAGDPRGAGIGTKEAIQMVWSCHREIITDQIVEEGWVQPQAS
jgi:1-pyrroline-5-carboxylate dehydrogenase